MTRRTTAQLVSLALAALMTLGMFGGVDRLAVAEAAQAPDAVVTAHAGTPAALHHTHLRHA